MNEKILDEIRREALYHEIPIMEDDGLNFILDFLKQENVTSLLEVGTAVGYSAIAMCHHVENLTVTSLEIDEIRYRWALMNIEKAAMEDRIRVELTDARKYETDQMFDCLFLDGPKAHNQELLERFEKNVKPGGFVIVDDVYFHGLVDKPELVKTRRLRALVRKLGKFRDDFLSNEKYDSNYLAIGDGIIVAKKRED